MDKVFYFEKKKEISCRWPSFWLSSQSLRISIMKRVWMSSWMSAGRRFQLSEFISSFWSLLPKPSPYCAHSSSSHFFPFLIIINIFCSFIAPLHLEKNVFWACLSKLFKVGMCEWSWSLGEFSVKIFWHFNTPPNKWKVSKFTHFIRAPSSK